MKEILTLFSTLRLLKTKLKFGTVTANKAYKTVFYNSIEKKEIFHYGRTVTLDAEHYERG